MAATTIIYLPSTSTLQPPFETKTWTHKQASFVLRTRTCTEAMHSCYFKIGPGTSSTFRQLLPCVSRYVVPDLPYFIDRIWADQSAAVELAWGLGLEPPHPTPKSKRGFEPLPCQRHHLETYTTIIDLSFRLSFMGYRNIKFYIKK